MSVLVAGGAGYIGSVMVRALMDAGESPVVFDNLSAGHRRLVPKNVPFVKGDLRNFKHICATLKKHKVNAIMHFAAAALVGESMQNPLKYYDNNVLAGVLLLRAMQEAKVKKFIFSSTCAIFGEPKRIPILEDDPKSPTNPYGESKLMIETMLKNHANATDFRYVALRYFNACGAHTSEKIGEMHDPETHLIPNILKMLTGEKKELHLYGDDYDTPDGTCIRDYVHVEDIADAHLLALDWLRRKKTCGIFNLGAGKGYSIRDVISAVERVTGKKVPVRVVARRSGDPSRLVASPEKARRTLGWNPKHNLQSIISSAWAWEQKQPKKKKIIGR